MLERLRAHTISENWNFIPAPMVGESQLSLASAPGGSYNSDFPGHLCTCTHIHTHAHTTQYA